MNIRKLKGIGTRTEELFQNLDVYTTKDLMELYPRAYDSYDEPVNIAAIDECGIYAVYAAVDRPPELKQNGRYKILTVMVRDEAGSMLRITWFNMPFLRSRLRNGYRYIFRGKVAIKGSLVFMEQPSIYTVDEYYIRQSSMQPVYPLTAGLTNNMVIKAVKQCFESGGYEEFLPEWILTKNDLIDEKKAHYAIHFPKDRNELAQARKRIIFDEFFLFTTNIRCAKSARLNEDNLYRITESGEALHVLKNLPYSLTGAQKKVYSEILNDMGSDKTMNRLIQGDVGSGKTILAFLAMINTAAAGWQSILMAPTEVLARQHYEALKELIDKNRLDFTCVLLTGALTEAKKRDAKEKITSGEADFIIGTHALITDDVEFKNPALVITDEQHRFGVRQRENLSRKGETPHIIVMSATPIPRSLAIILYGDLDISIVDEKPADRLPVKNCVVDDSYRTKAYKFISDEIKKGHQAYIICAMAEESDNDSNLENVVDFSKKLKEAMPETRIEYLHGKMKPAEKNRIMDEFAKRNTDILVSTTVVEVGINVPNATVMMVINAERFGLAGLHQLRGRVGRGKEQSYCIFESNTKNKVTKERLNILKESNDGFYISEQDLKLRGPGDMLGTRQSGDMGFAIGNIYSDASILKMAADTSSILIEKDKELMLEENSGIRDRIRNTESKINI